jgi:UDP-3-O-[3-hydroxymyristoyl] N-acetylglucosamine deacetylase / 3-hydroxyacyl-[acyl-carrier-protein] dehydratase
MYLKQHTIQHPVSLSGIGLHTGQPVDMVIKPAPEDYGFRFTRVDMPGQPTIRALVENVVDWQRSTTIGEDGARVQTIEHLLAALSGLQIDNAIIELSSGEPPALDGSAKGFVELLKQSGVVEQNANRSFYVIDEPIHYYDPEKGIDLAALEFDGFRLTVTIDYNSNQLGIQHATLKRIEDFETEIAMNRTFCFWHEIVDLVKSGMIKGGNLDNAVVFVDRAVENDERDLIADLFQKKTLETINEGVLSSTSLHFPNEPARHKLLDLVGDLTLLGAPLKGQVIANRPGHRSNVAFAKKIQSVLKQKRIIKKYQMKEAQGVVFDINAIQSILPHRYPFLLVDKIIDFTEKSIVGIKNVTINEPFFQGHFDGNPIMPGVLIIESMAQVGGVLLLNIVEEPKQYWVYLIAADQIRFRKPVVPGDQMEIRLELLNLKRGICKMAGKVFVGETLVCEAEVMASLVKKNP